MIALAQSDLPEQIRDALRDATEELAQEIERANAGEDIQQESVLGLRVRVRYNPDTAAWETMLYPPSVTTRRGGRRLLLSVPARQAKAARTMRRSGLRRGLLLSIPTQQTTLLFSEPLEEVA